jgi:hypothetical protein
MRFIPGLRIETWGTQIVVSHFAITLSQSK